MSHFGRPLNNVFVRVTKILDPAHTGVNMDPPEFGIDPGFGLWKYTAPGMHPHALFGVVGPDGGGHNTATRLVTFNFPDYSAPYSISFAAYASLSYATHERQPAFAEPADPRFNACLADGAVPDSQSVVTTADAIRQLPFAFTVYGSTRSFIGFRNNGVLAFGTSSADALTGNPTSGANSALPLGGGAPAVFAFWEDIEYRPASPSGEAGRMCHKVVGAAPYRQAVVTWENMQFAGSAGGDDLDFSVVLHEGIDRPEVVRHRMASRSTRPGRRAAARTSGSRER